MSELLDLKMSVLAAEPSADISVLDKLSKLIQKHNLRWIPAPSGSQDNAYFVASHLSVAKGLKADDYKNHWATRLPESAPSNSLAGREFLLEGEYLAKFKELWKETHGESLGRINSLYVVDWRRAYAYLSQGKTELARGFQDLGASAVELSIKNNYSYKQEQTFSEEQIQAQIQLLSTYSNIKLRFEVGSTAGVSPFDDASYRRFDFVELTPKSVRIYELKSHAVTEFDIKTTLIDKKYILVAAEQYRRPIEFIFISPQGHTWEAENYLSDLTRGTNQIKLGDIEITVKFQHLHELGDRITNNIVRINPPEQLHWLQKRLAEFQIVSGRTAAKLKARIDKAYASGLLKSNKVQYIKSTVV